MSVLRRVKLRTPDGIESIEYPLGVDAENVEVANGENLSQRLARIDEDLENNEEDIAAVGELAGTNKQNIGANEIRIDALERRSASVDKKPYYFNTVADMKAYQGLKEGDMAITLGYYEANDGGGAEYKIVSGNYTDDGGSYHKLNNNLYAELIVKNKEVNIKQFGAYGDNQHDDTDAIQMALNFNKNVFIPEGTYKISQITINRYQYFHGVGRRSVLNSTLDNTNNDIFAIIIPASSDRIILKDFRCNGGIDNATTGTATEQDTNNTFENITISSGYGFKLHHRGNYLHNIRCGGTKYGIYISGTDNIVNSCVTAVTDSHGFVIGGANNSVINSKSFIAGNTTYGVAFFITGAFARVSNCEAQQNRYENYWLQNTYGSIIQNSISDGAFWGKANITSYTSPVFNTAINTSSIFLHNLNSCIIDITNINGSNFGTPAATYEVLGIHYPATIHKCSINIASFNRNNYYNILHSNDLFRYVSNNSLILNGINFNSFINGKNLILKEINASYTAGQTQTFYSFQIPIDSTKIAINFDKVGDTSKFNTIIWDILVVNVKDGQTKYSASPYQYFTENANNYYDIKSFIDSLEADSITAITIRFRGTAKNNQEAFNFILNNIHIVTSNSLISDNI